MKQWDPVSIASLEDQFPGWHPPPVPGTPRIPRRQSVALVGASVASALAWPTACQAGGLQEAYDGFAATYSQGPVAVLETPKEKSISENNVLCSRCCKTDPPQDLHSKHPSTMGPNSVSKNLARG